MLRARKHGGESMGFREGMRPWSGCERLSLSLSLTCGADAWLTLNEPTSARLLVGNWMACCSRRRPSISSTSAAALGSTAPSTSTSSHCTVTVTHARLCLCRPRGGGPITKPALDRVVVLSSARQSPAQPPAKQPRRLRTWLSLPASRPVPLGAYAVVTVALHPSEPAEFLPET